MATKNKFEVRKMMQLAVEVMRQSIPEHRIDESPSPSVGAVLVRPNGTYETAARGELREGNHAEYILLERKCYGEKLDGCLLFTTLEPCMERNDPKRGCAKHIVSARIKQVYVGIEDDNPKVAGKGIKHLLDHGVKVEMFPIDLQKEIQEDNKLFFEWARRQIEKPKSEPSALSQCELPINGFTLIDLSDSALQRYRLKAKIKPAVGSHEFNRLLLQQGLLIESNGVLL